ncbi:ligand-gated ion channel 4-like [Mytilus trossulus]|uniref:ligand-gated ion channel 4-like n=1 Tax=Mytilus trossulus TaxID=6551 RepID=UPI0030045DE6
MSWTDAFLTWNKSLYGEIDKISAPISRIWQPDVFLTNYADTSNIFDDVTKRVNIFSNGRVERHDDIEIKTYCFVNPTRYPFETETCELNFAAQQLDINEQILHIKLPDNFLNYFKSNGEWLISKPDKIRSYMTTIENSSGRNFSGVVLQIEMERRQTYYVWKFLVPTITITLINIVTFFIPVTSGAKVPLSTFVLFVLIGIIEIFNESLPTSSDKISYFGSLLWCLLAISGLVLIVNVIITVIFKCGTCERLCAIWNCEKNGNNTNEEGDTTETQETIRSADDCSTSSCAKKGKKRTKRNYEPLQESPAKEETTISLELSEVKVELQGTEPQRQPPNEQSLRPASEDDSTKLADDKRGDNKDTTKGKRSTNRKYIGLYAVGFLVMLIAYTTAYAYFLVQIFFEKKTENVA